MSTYPAEAIQSDATPLPQMTPSLAAMTKVAGAMARDQGPERTADQAIKLLARSLGRQAARRHLARGWSMMEVTLALTVAALALAAALYIQAQLGRLP